MWRKRYSIASWTRNTGDEAVNRDFSEAAYYAWIASANMPPEITRQLLEEYKTPSECSMAFEQGDDRIDHILPPRFRSVLAQNRTESFMSRMQLLMNRNAVSILRYDDPDYPASLAAVDQSPAFLFYQGNVLCLRNRTLSMVGSRAASYDGQKAAGKLACDLSRQGVSIVSGLACGIDAAAHQGCIAGGSPTIAVTACGPDTVYPKEHIRLRDEIIGGNGLILTEYAPGEKPAGWHFPFRNRLIAGLGNALVLVEARIRSGSMTTVNHALNQGKDVFVYPGDPVSEQFEGNHRLLREGGIYFTCAEDILRDLNWLDNHTAVRHNSDCSAETPAVSPDQALIIKALKPGKLSFEQLAEKTGMNPSVLMGTLTILQISGIVESLPGKQYQLKH